MGEQRGLSYTARPTALGPELMKGLRAARVRVCVCVRQLLPSQS